MSSHLSVLAKASAISVQIDPFPHVIIEDALETHVADQLRQQFPKLDDIGVDQSLSNNRWDLSAHEIAESGHVSDLWKSVIAYHVSQEFWSEFHNIFGNFLKEAESQLGFSFGAARIGIRGKDFFKSQDLILDAQISGNTPVRAKSSVRGTHVDKGDKVFSALLYLRDEDDKSEGGDFVIQRWRKGVPRKLRPIFYHEGMSLFRKSVTAVPYRHNTLVLLLNSLDSLHAVTARSTTNHSRKFMNLVGVVSKNVYEVPDHNLASKLSRRLGQRRRVGRSQHKNRDEC